MTNIAHADCPSGASGDMILAACLDAGLPFEYLKSQLAELDLGGYVLSTGTQIKQGLAGRRFEITVSDQPHHRSWADIRQLIQDSRLTETVKEKAAAVFKRLAAVEARLHGVSPEEVTFHEVGAVDSIIDVVGAAIAWEYFELTRLYVSPLPLGSGWVETQHGRLPLPAPASLALLEGVPTYGTWLDAELVTPTGAAILTTLAYKFGPRPAMTITAVGYGAGSRDLPDRPNILRLTLGRAETDAYAPATDHRLTERLVAAETNIDDMNPELFPYLMDRLLAAGALDAWMTPIQMKKGRPGVKFSFLARPADVSGLLDLVFQESTTIGVRTYQVERQSLARESVSLDTPWGKVRAKVIIRGDKTELAPEYEACRRIAEETGLPLKEIYEKIKRHGGTPAIEIRTA